MALGTEVDAALRDNVLDGDPATPEKGHTHPHPIFGPCLLWPNGWMDEDATCTEVDLGHAIVLDGVPALRERGTAAPPLFSAHVYCGDGRPSQLLLSFCYHVLSDRHHQFQK